MTMIRWIPLPPSSLLGNAAAYGVGLLFARAAKFALVPFVLLFLSVSDMALVGLSEITVGLLMSFLGLGTTEAITRYYWEWKREGVEKESLGTVWILGSLFNAVLLAVLFLVGKPLFAMWASQLPFAPYVPMLLFISFFRWQHLFLIMTFRAQERARPYAVFYNIAEWVTAASIFVALLLGRQGALSYVQGLWVGWGVAGLACQWEIQRNIRLRLRLGMFRELLRFSLPIVPASVMDQTGSLLDRFILDKLLPLRELGLYTTGMKLGQMLLSVNFPIKQTWIPYAIRASMESSDRDKLGYVGTLCLALLGTAALLIAFLGKGLLSLDRYAEFKEIVPWIGFFVLAHLPLAVNTILSVGISISKVTTPLIGLTGLHFALQAILLPVLGRPWGWPGTLLTLASINAVTCLVRYRTAQRLHALPYHWRPFCWILLALLGMSFISFWGSSPWTLAPAISISLFLTAVAWSQIGKLRPDREILRQGMVLSNLKAPVRLAVR